MSNSNIENYVKRFSPEIMKNNDTMQSLYSVQRDEIESFNVEINSTIDNAFFQSLNLQGVQKWEKILGLKSNASLDVNMRRKLLLIKRQFRPPFTKLNLQKILESMWGDGNYMFEISPDKFQLIVDINTDEAEVYLEFQNHIRRVIPANIYVIFDMRLTKKVHKIPLYIKEGKRWKNICA